MDIELGHLRRQLETHERRSGTRQLAARRRLNGLIRTYLEAGGGVRTRKRNYGAEEPAEPVRPEWVTKKDAEDNFYYDKLSKLEKDKINKIKETSDLDAANALFRQSMQDQNRTLIQVIMELKQHLASKEEAVQEREEDVADSKEVCVLCQEPVFRSLRSTFRCEVCGNALHQQCARKSFKECPRCPTCRTWVFDMLPPKKVWASSTNYVPYFEGDDDQERMIFGEVWVVVVDGSAVSGRSSGAREPNLPDQVISDINRLDSSPQKRRKSVRGFRVPNAKQTMLKLLKQNPVYVTVNDQRLEGFKIDPKNVKWGVKYATLTMGDQQISYDEEKTVVVLANPLFSSESRFPAQLDRNTPGPRWYPDMLVVQTRGNADEKWRTISTCQTDYRLVGRERLSPHPYTFKLLHSSTDYDEVEVFGNTFSLLVRSILKSGGFEETDWRYDLRQHVRIVELHGLENENCFHLGEDEQDEEDYEDYEDYEDNGDNGDNGDYGDYEAGDEESSDASSLLQSAYNGDTEGMKELLEKGVEPDVVVDPFTPCYAAAQMGWLDLVELLLERGADPNKARTDTGETPCYAAAERGKLDVVRLLLERGADPNKARTDNGETPCIVAGRNGHDEVVEVLQCRCPGCGQRWSNFDDLTMWGDSYICESCFQDRRRQEQQDMN